MVFRRGQALWCPGVVVVVVVVGSFLQLDVLSAAASPPCSPGIVPNSNRDAGNPCTGSIGEECSFTCSSGYYATGKHVCTNYTVGTEHFVEMKFFGGHCERVCSDPSAVEKEATECVGAAKIRFNSTDASGPCFRSTCFNSSDAALRHVARGNFEVWRQLRHPTTGMYVDNYDAVCTRAPRETVHPVSWRPG